MNAPINAGSAAKATRALAPSLERRRLRIYLALVVLDIALILAGFNLVGLLYLDYRPFQFALLQAQLLLPLYLTLAIYQRCTRSPRSRMRDTPRARRCSR